MASINRNTEHIENECENGFYFFIQHKQEGLSKTRNYEKILLPLPLKHTDDSYYKRERASFFSFACVT